MKGLITSSRCYDVSCLDNVMEVSCKDAMEKLNSYNSILETQLMELESVSSGQATEA